MRMRRKKWARPELSVCPYFMKDPSKNRGHWAEQFERPEQPFWLELGCGKGTYAARVAADHPEINLLAIDIKERYSGSSPAEYPGCLCRGRASGG